MPKGFLESSNYVDYSITSFVSFKRPVLSGFCEVTPSLTQTLKLSLAGIPPASRNKCRRKKWIFKF